MQDFDNRVTLDALKLGLVDVLGGGDRETYFTLRDALAGFLDANDLAIESTGSEQKKDAGTPELGEATFAPRRERLPDTRSSLTHKFSIDGHEGYLTVGLYPDGRPGEVFIQMAKEGSTLGGLMDAFAIQTSIALQYGVPLEQMVRKHSHSRYEPAGFTKCEFIRNATSITDYLFRWMEHVFLRQDVGEAPAE